ncbi:MAG: hypothetical protein HQK96_06115 [Nitrospirae bacterium]|nr:hypothetical protein [Nitrospirota bacterium]
MEMEEIIGDGYYVDDGYYAMSDAMVKIGVMINKEIADSFTRIESNLGKLDKEELRLALTWINDGISGISDFIEEYTFDEDAEEGIHDMIREALGIQVFKEKKVRRV